MNNTFNIKDASGSTFISQNIHHVKANNLPALVGNYKETKDFYEKLNQVVKQNTGKKILVYGFPGVGKSAGVVGWAKNTNIQFSLKCYIFARSGNIFEQLANFFIDNQSDLGFNGKEKLKQIKNPNEVLKTIRGCWGGGKKLLILDDVMPENDKDVNELLETLKGLDFCVVLTSRRPKIHFHHAEYDLIELPASQELCMDILADVYKNNEEEKIVAQELCEYVGNNTFAIEQIWNLAKMENDFGEKPTLSELYKKIKQEKILKNSILSQKDQHLFHKDGVYQTLELIWKKLNEDEQFLALLCGQMALAPIPQYWFDALITIENKEKDKIGLIRWLILNQNKESKTFKLHELWYKFLRGDKTEEEIKQHQIILHKIFTSSLIEIVQSFKDPNQITKEDVIVYSKLIPHLTELVNICNSLTMDEFGDYLIKKEAVIVININLGIFYQAQTQYDQAIKYYVKSREFAHKIFGKENYFYLVATVYLADAYLQKSWYCLLEEKVSLLQKAKELLEEVKDQQLQATDQEKLERTFLIIKLADVYKDLGILQNNHKYKQKAIIYFHENINTLTKLTTSTSLNTSLIYEQIGTNYNNLSEIYINLENYTQANANLIEALKKIQKAREILQLKKPNDSSFDNSYARSYHSLACLYWNAHIYSIISQKWLKTKMNHKREAWENIQKAMKIRSLVLEKNHSEYKLTQELLEQMKAAGWDKA